MSVNDEKNVYESFIARVFSRVMHFTQQHTWFHYYNFLCTSEINLHRMLSQRENDYLISTVFRQIMNRLTIVTTN